MASATAGQVFLPLLHHDQYHGCPTSDVIGKHEASSARTLKWFGFPDYYDDDQSDDFSDACSAPAPAPLSVQSREQTRRNEMYAVAAAAVETVVDSDLDPVADSDPVADPVAVAVAADVDVDVDAPAGLVTAASVTGCETKATGSSSWSFATMKAL